MVSRGVPIETVSQMMGHKSIIEDKPYITHDTHQISFVAMDFSDVPITSGFYFGRNIQESPDPWREVLEHDP